MDMRPYVVRQGDYLAKLAYAMGFDADTVWSDDKNRELRERRPNPDLLHPGDVLHVPAVPPRGAKIRSQTTNRYKASLPSTPVRLVLRDGAGRPLANKAYEVRGLAEPHRGTTDGDGLAALSVPLHLREVSLIMVESGQAYRVMIGDMDPVEERSGMRKRLEHLMYLSRASLPEEGDAEEAMREAIRAFQTAQSLEVTGESDAATRAALVAAHGS